MPDSWRKAFLPTIALFGGTTNPVILLTKRDTLNKFLVLIAVAMPPKTSGRVLIDITISSRDALPARSPMPLIVQCAWHAPAMTADSELATAIPKSSWQWMETTASLILGTLLKIS